MSLFGAMSTAISGLTSQSAAFSNISDDVANSQTVGFKRVDTNFEDYLTTSTPQVNDSGAVVATPDYVNTVQGTITQTDNPLALAIAGQGFFAVSQPSGELNGQTTFDPQTYYTRTGDFTVNKDGYLVNSAGDYLNAWAVSPDGTVNQGQLVPVQISQGQSAPVATSQVTLAANLPATPSSTTPISSQINVYDAQGTLQPLTMTWTQVGSNDWNVTVSSTNATPSTIGTADVKFGTNGEPSGTLSSITDLSGTTTPAATQTSGAAATLGLTANFGSGAQAITLNLGNFGQTSGITQFAGTTYSLSNISQNGVPPGGFSSVSTTQNGDIVINYSNGQSSTVYQVPLTVFPDADALQRQNGQAFTQTSASGDGTTQSAGSNGAGTLVTSSVESSNVDIATEFSNLIIAQRAYTANTKMVTTADDMLQATIDMKR